MLSKIISRFKIGFFYINYYVIVLLVGLLFLFSASLGTFIFLKILNLVFVKEFILNLFRQNGIKIYLEVKMWKSRYQQRVDINKLQKNYWNFYIREILCIEKEIKKTLNR